ncbi:MAG: PhzF family phenazine biosynthesis protein [Chitinophagales bacterium]
MDSNKTVEVQILNAFVDNNKGGNPAGVVLNADNLSTPQKLEIAKAVGLSETAFVSTSKTADFKLDFFTPNKQIAHCGHATIATFSYLSQLGKVPNPITSKETIDGNRKINVTNGLAFMEQKAPSYTDVSNRKKDILTSLSLKEEDLLEGACLSLVNTGNSFFIIPVANSKVLRDIQPNSDLIKQLSEEFDLIGYYVFTLDVEEQDRDVTTRMFAPRYGIEEEAGTGMAAGPLACYLYDKIKIKKNKFMIQQGKFMMPASISLIITKLDIFNDKIIGLMTGGKGIAISKKIINLKK